MLRYIIEFILIFSCSLNATKVIFLPQIHGGTDQQISLMGDLSSSGHVAEMDENIYSSQLKIYNYLKNLFDTEGMDNVLVFSEDMFYSIKDGKIIRKAPPKQGNTTDREYLVRNGASYKLANEGIKTPFQPTVFLGENSPYNKAKAEFDEFINGIATLLAYRQKEDANIEIFNALAGEEMEKFYTKLFPLIELPREHEVISKMAESIKANPQKIHVLIFGAAHRFSRYFKDVSGIQFEIPPGFAEDSSGPYVSDHDFQEYIAIHKNPLLEIGSEEYK